MPHYFLKLNPCRPNFSQDMMAEERAVMTRHVAYWTDLMQKGLVVVFGPVFDPKGGYGIGVVEMENEGQVLEFIKNDPASAINSYEYYPMRAIMPSK